MKKMILSSLTGGAVFIALYNLGIMENVWLAIGAALLAYFAVNLILSDDKSEIDLKLEDTENAKVIIQRCSDYVKLIRKTAYAVESQELSSSIESICGTLDRILKYITDNPQQAKQLRKFMQYYLPVIYKILVQYDEIEDQQLTGEVSRQLTERIVDLVKKLKPAFENKLNELNEGKVMDTDAEIRVLETMLKNDGLIEDMDFTMLKKKVEP